MRKEAEKAEKLRQEQALAEKQRMEKEAQEAKLLLEQQLLEAKQNKGRQDFSIGMDEVSEDMMTSLLRSSLSSLFKDSISFEKERLETLRLQKLEQERIE